MYLLGELPTVVIAGNLWQFFPSGQHYYLVCMPLYPIHLVQGTGLWVIGHLSADQILPIKEFLEVGAPAVVNTLNLPLSLPQVLTSQTHHLVPSHSARLVGATGGLQLSLHPFPGYPWMTRGPALGKGHTLLLLGRAQRLGLPSNSALWQKVP